MMKKKSLLMAVCGLMACSSLAWSQPQQRPSEPSLVVTGQGEVMATPDQATVRLGAEAQAPTAAQAQSQVNEVMQRALQDIRALGIDEKRIRTLGVSLQPVYARQRPTEEPVAPQVVAYRASNTIQVEVSDLTLVGKVIDTGIKAGANRQDGVSFELKNDLAARTQALQIAVAQARAKASTLATALGVQLDTVLEVHEGGVSVFPPPTPYGGGFARAEMMMADTQVQPGQLTVQASVTIRYRIRP